MSRFTFRYLLQVFLFLLYTILIVPFSTDDYLSWSVFLTHLAVRLAIVIAFLAVTRKIVQIDDVIFDTVVPRPTPQPAEAESSVEERPAAIQFGPVRFPFKFKLIPLVSGAMFIGNLFLNRDSYTPLLSSPSKAIALISEFFSSFVLALFVAMLLFWLALPVRPNALPLRARAAKWLRPRTLVLAIIFLVAAAFWLDESVWWSGWPWFNSLWSKASDWTADLFGVACLLIFFLPNPAQLNVDQPEIIRITPGAEPEHTAEKDDEM